VKDIQRTNTDCTFGSYIRGVVRSSTKQKKGDSGSVVYYKQPQSSSSDHLYVVHLAMLRPDGTDYAAGSSAEKLYDSEGVWYGGEPYSG